jgi:glycosyltransferase involved in cell wall biosynthesis
MAQTRPTISVVINTKNSAHTLDRCLASVHSWADEIVVMDMKSTDDTVAIAKFYGARTFSHPDVGYVEPARNAALAKASGEWILILDSDEEIPPTLAKTITRTLIENTTTDAYFLPRKNIIFDKWVKTGWWPDHLLRLFRTGKVTWSDEIHAVPSVKGTVERLDATEANAIRHYNYQSVEQYWKRALTYGKVRTTERKKARETVHDPLQAFLDEYIRRYYAWNGQEDGAHGRFLSALQGSTAILEQSLLWETKKFKEQDLEVSPLTLFRQAAQQANYWTWTQKINKSQGITRLLFLVARKLNLPAPETHTL